MFIVSFRRTCYCIFSIVCVFIRLFSFIETNTKYKHLKPSTIIKRSPTHKSKPFWYVGLFFFGADRNFVHPHSFAWGTIFKILKA